jgi:hypothetical protein
VVGVQHDRRCALWPVSVPDDGGSATFPDDLNSQTLGAQQRSDGLRAGFNVHLIEGRQRHTGYPGQRFEVLAQCGQEVSDPRLQGTQSGRVKVWVENIIGHVRERTHPVVPGGQEPAIRSKGPTRHTVVFVFGRKKDPKDSTSSAVTYAERPGAKNRPTPSRREQESANKRPLVPTDRKAAAGQSREAAREARAKQRAALLSGDESALPARDKGPIKRYIRDTVDARWNIGEFMLPIMFAVLALTFVPAILKSAASVANLLVFTLVYALVVIGALDAFMMWRRTKAKVIAKFGEAPPRGSAMYAVMRAFQMRRSRLPRPQVKRASLKIPGFSRK